jgi:CheY-like chemotaxis protein
MPRRSVPLIVVASASAALAEDIAARLRRDGNVVYVTHSAAGCLRVATSIAPDVILLDPQLPRRLEDLLHAHPASARAHILHLTTPRSAFRVPRVPVTAGPHAA